MDREQLGRAWQRLVTDEATTDSSLTFPHPLQQEFVSKAQRIVAADYQAEGLSEAAWNQLYTDFDLRSPDERAIVDAARSTVFRYFGPFITKVAVDMLADLAKLQASSNRRLRAIFVGRDALALSYAMHQLDPAFHYFYCRELGPVSRAVTDRVIAQASKWWPERLEAIEKYRFNKRAPYRSRTTEPQTWDEMLDYLQIDSIDLKHRLAVDDFVVIDTGYKGSIQEMLAAAFPQVTFRGMYLFHAATDAATSPKKGYVLDLDPERGRNGEAIRDRVIDNEDLTFAHHDGIVAIEELLCGGLDIIIAEDPLEGINPSTIAAHYRPRSVRLAVFTASQLAVADYAARLRTLRRKSGFWYDELTEESKALPQQIYGWLTGRQMDKQLRELLDSFVRRADKHLVKELASYLSKDQRESEAEAWKLYSRRTTLRGKRKAVRRIIHQVTKRRQDCISG